jgi:hypothetical protein
MTRAEILERTGRALSPGPDWRSALSAVLRIRADTVRQMLSGRLEPKDGHFRDLLAAMANQRKELERAEQKLREFLAQQAEEES